MKILAIDYGLARTGLAVCDVLETIATPLASVPSRNGEKLLLDVCRTVREQGVEKIVVGRPSRTDGAKSEMAEKAEMFAQTVSERTGVPVEMFDERFTTVIASKRLHENDMNTKKQRAVIDAAAAAVLLEDYLRTRK